MDQLSAMRAFVRVAESGSFTQAADRLDIPKPTVTKLIQTLEAHLRLKLLNRTTRRVTVTPDGAAYYERVVQILGDLDELEGNLMQAQALPTGRLRVDVSGVIATLVILPALGAFQARFPEIQIDLGVSDRPVDLVGENIDCVLRAGDLVDQSLIARRIAEIHSITCAAPAYLERHGAPTDPRELESDHHMVGYFSARGGRAKTATFTRGAESVEVKARHKIAVNDGGAYLAAGLAGLGIIRSPIFMALPHLPTGELKPIMSDWSTPSWPLHVVYPPNRHLSNRLRVFVDWVATLFADARFTRREV